MQDGPDIAGVAALIADPSRSAMLLALMDGRALTATELASVAGIAKQTASSHLARLVDGDVLRVETQGRHRYFRLAGAHVATLIEALLVFRGNALPATRTGPREPALRKARACYDHLAGDLGVLLYDCVRANGWIAAEGSTLSERGRERFARLGLAERDVPKGSRPMFRECLDWSARRPHLGGLAGKLVFDRLLALGWARRIPSSRAIQFSTDGERRFREWMRQ